MSDDITAAQFHAERMNSQFRTQDAERLRAGLREVRRYALKMLGRSSDDTDAQCIMKLCEDAQRIMKLCEDALNEDCTQENPK